MEEPKKPMGRPSVYDPKMCKIVIDELSKGKSITAVAGVLNISRETIYAWKNDPSKPDFSDAVRRGVAKGQNFFEERLIMLVSGQKVKGFDPKLCNPTALLTALKVRFNKDWGDVTKHEFSGEPIKITITPEDANL